MSNVNQFVRIEGPWTHKNVGAFGAGFHTVISGDAPDRHTVVLLHDFPMHWYSWRRQIEDLANAGYRVLAVDMRGFGGSDYQPGTVDLPHLGNEVTGVLRATGTGPFTVVGSGMGGSVAWMVAHQNPGGLQSMVAVCSPHPASKCPRSAPRAIAARRVEREISISPFKHRHLRDGSLVRRVLKMWCAPAHVNHMESVSPIYEAAMSRVYAASSALETLRGTKKTNLSTQRALKNVVTVPILSISGGWDGRVPLSAYKSDSLAAGCPVKHRNIDESGHFPNEETPQQLTDLLLEHLAAVKHNVSTSSTSNQVTQSFDPTDTI